MPVPTAPTTAVASQPARSSQQFNALALQVSWLISPPIVMMRQTVAQSIPAGVMTSILMDTEDIDRDAGHSIVANTSRYNCVTAGWYQVDATVAWAANATNRRSCQILYTANGGGSSVVAGSQRLYLPVGTGSPSVGTSCKVFMNVGDFIELQGFQDTSGSLFTNVGSVAQQSVLQAVWISS